MSTRVTDFPLSGDEDSTSLSPDELRHLSGRQPGAPRRVGRVVLMVVIVLAMQAGVVWQLHRSVAAKRVQVAMEMRDFERRAQALRTEMSTLQDRIGQTREQLGDLHTRAARPAQPRVEPRPGNRPAGLAARPTGRPQPQQPARPVPAPIVLTPGCADTPLGC